MKVVVLAGGLGTRLSEETGARPKPMVEIGGKPWVWGEPQFLPITAFPNLQPISLPSSFFSYGLPADTHKIR